MKEKIKIEFEVSPELMSEMNVYGLCIHENYQQLIEAALNDYLNLHAALIQKNLFDRVASKNSDPVVDFNDIKF